MSSPDPFAEAGPTAPTLRDLGLRIEGTPLEPIVGAFRRELEAGGLANLDPEFYLSTG